MAHIHTRALTYTLANNSSGLLKMRFRFDTFTDMYTLALLFLLLNYFVQLCFFQTTRRALALWSWSSILLHTLYQQ